MAENNRVSRRRFLGTSVAAAGAAAGAGAGLTHAAEQTAAEQTAAAEQQPAADPDSFPCGQIGSAKISRLLLGGNLVSGYMHARDLKYVTSLFRAYATEEKMMETFHVAEQHGINTVFETGAEYVRKYNERFNGHMQFIPHIRVDLGMNETALTEHIQKQVDSGAVALYVWGVAADNLVKNNAVDQLARAVELAKKHGLPIGVGGHSLKVPMACEANQIPCDFYVKTFHRDDYPSAIPTELREGKYWLNEVEGYYDNMWCLHPVETAEFMKTVTKPWLAFKVLAAGAYLPQQGFTYAIKNGADFMAVGMFDFQIKQNCERARLVVRREQDRERPWRA